jgi:hypothetical protein
MPTPCIRVLSLVAGSFVFASFANAQSAAAKLTFLGATDSLPSLTGFQCPGTGSPGVVAPPECPGPVFPNVQLLAQEMPPPLPFFEPSNHSAEFMSNFGISPEPFHGAINLSGPLFLKNGKDVKPEPLYRHDEAVARKPLDVRPTRGPEFWSLWAGAGALLVTAVEMDARCWNIPECVKGPSRAALYPINLVPFAISFYFSDKWKRDKYGDTWGWKANPIIEIVAQSVFITLHVAKVSIIQ